VAVSAVVSNESIAMTELVEVDIRGYSLEKFCLFLFDREIPPTANDGSEDSWYYSVEVRFDAHEVAGHYVNFFTNPEFLRSRFSRPQLEQGFWAILGPNLSCGAAQLIWLQEVPFSVREKCVRSMFHLYERFFAMDSLDIAAYMWWDGLCYDWHMGRRSRANGGEDQLMQDVMFETLSKILDLDSEACQKAALHGLGHLRHPSTETVIRGFLDRRQGTIDAELKEYALAAARFGVQ